MFKMTMREFSKGEIRKMKSLKEKNFSNKEVSSVLHLSADRVDKFLGDQENVKTDIGPKKETRNKGGDQPPDTDKLTEGREPTGNNNEGSPGDQINFVGGNNMGKETEGTTEEKTYYKCYNCNYQSETVFSVCPKCDKENNFE